MNDPRNLTNLTAPTLQESSQLESYYYYGKNIDDLDILQEVSDDAGDIAEKVIDGGKDKLFLGQQAAHMGVHLTRTMTRTLTKK